MDLSDSEVDAAFRTEFRAWLEANIPAEWKTDEFWMQKSPAESFDLRREWEANKARQGYAGINWPKEYGGRGGTATQKAIYDEEMARAGAPVTVNTLGLTFLGPTVMAIGSDAQKREIIKPMLHNEVIWCQGFSEPGAGSDLAALATKATDAGDHWVVNGQKVWTTNALHADRMFGLVRTDPQSQRHRGLSMLLIDMHADGVDARPLKQMTGNEEFGEVFLTDVKVPKDAVLGEVRIGLERRDAAAVVRARLLGDRPVHAFSRRVGSHRRGRPQDRAEQGPGAAPAPVRRPRQPRDAAAALLAHPHQGRAG